MNKNPAIFLGNEPLMDEFLLKLRNKRYQEFIFGDEENTSKICMVRAKHPVAKRRVFWERIARKVPFFGVCKEGKMD
jgi:hypothetical protein